MNSTQNNTMSDITFGALLKTFKPEADSSIDHVCMKSVHGCHEIGIYAFADQEYDLVIQEFGYESSEGDWTQLKCSEKQYDKLKQILSMEISRMINEIEVKEQEELETAEQI